MTTPPAGYVHVPVDEHQLTTALNSRPSFLSEQGIDPVIRALYAWIKNVVMLLYGYLATMFGDNIDRIDALEASVAALQAMPRAQPAPSTPRQPQRPSSSTRCPRCHALGHTVTDCRTKDPAAQKKRVAATQKAAKEMERRRMAALLPRRSLANSTFPVHLDDFFGDPIIPAVSPRGGVVIPTLPDHTTTRSQARSLMGLAADATELRRRRIQSTRDKRRRNASSTNAPDNP